MRLFADPRGAAPSKKSCLLVWLSVLVFFVLLCMLMGLVTRGPWSSPAHEGLCEGCRTSGCARGTAQALCARSFARTQNKDSDPKPCARGPAHEGLHTRAKSPNEGLHTRPSTRTRGSHLDLGLAVSRRCTKSLVWAWMAFLFKRTGMVGNSCCSHSAFVFCFLKGMLIVT